MRIQVHQYNEILTVTLDHQLAFEKGKLVFDEEDRAVQRDAFARAHLAKLVAQRNSKALRRMLKQLITSFFEFEDPYNFTQYLFEKTGYRITPIPKHQLSKSNRRGLHLSVSGEGVSAITCLQVLLPTASGLIYCIRGAYPELKAEWKADNTIEIVLPGEGEVLEKFNTVRYEGETISIQYKMPNLEKDEGNATS